MQIESERSEASQTAASQTAALTIIEAAWSELRVCPYVQSQMGIPLTRLPDVSLASAQRRSDTGRKLLRSLDALDWTGLSHDLELTLRLVRFRAHTWAREADWYWTVIDPLGIGFFGLFLPTAYCGGWLLSLLNDQLASFPLIEPGDADRYLGLVADYGRLIDQFAERTAGQAQRGVRIPKAQVPKARALLDGSRSALRKILDAAPQRIGSIYRDDFADEIESRFSTWVEPAFDRAVEELADAYLAHAPDAVGLGQYPNGPEIYAELVKLHTTLDLSPDQVHARGIARITEIETSMRAIRGELGFEGDAADFLAHLERDTRWRAATLEGVTAVFQRYIDRLEPRLDEFFSNPPKANYRVAPLPEALQESMTFGFYSPPRRGQADGVYFFNSGNLTKQPLFHLGALTYHELMPGHHLHLATQQESETLHPFRSHSSVNAYNEGWAEYAATFAAELGLYEQPEERYGRLVMDAFLTCRLVVDTGMNVLKWSLERARDYMRLHSGMSEAEILTESVRYSCDIPGQSLAYKLGDTQILALRERMRTALGARFDLKAFHAAILGQGALPMTDLQWHVEHEIKRLLSEYTHERVRVDAQT